MFTLGSRNVDIPGLGEERPMAHIRGPKRGDIYPDRDIDCEEALEARFDELLETGDVAAVLREALEAGWRLEEVRFAIRGLIAARAVSELGIDD
jgi:hypothetical protein